MPDLLRLYEAGEAEEDGYPLAWHEEIKDLIREQAGHRCIRCGHPYRTKQSNPEWSPCDDKCTHQGPFRYRYNEKQDWTFLAKPPRSELVLGPNGYLHLMNGATVEAGRRVLTVHHLDGNKLNCRWWNLAALCQRCHLQIQGRVKMSQIYPFEHSDWFKPYAAGYYALTYNGEEITREEAMDRLDDLLALEHSA